MPGIFTNRLGRSISPCSRLASCDGGARVVRPGSGSTSSETQPSRVASPRSNTGRSRSQASRMSSLARARKTSLGSSSVLRSPRAAGRRRRRPRRSRCWKIVGLEVSPTIPLLDQILQLAVADEVDVRCSRSTGSGRGRPTAEGGLTSSLLARPSRSSISGRVSRVVISAHLTSIGCRSGTVARFARGRAREPPGFGTLGWVSNVSDRTPV